MKQGSNTITPRKGGSARAAFFVPQTRDFFRHSRLSKGIAMVPDPRERPVVTAEEAFAELGIDRNTGYRAIRDGTFPLPVIRVGRTIRVPTVALRRALQLDDGATADRAMPEKGAA